jgi:hypothetical protein
MSANTVLYRLSNIEQNAATERNSERYGHISSLDVLSTIENLLDMDSLRLNRTRAWAGMDSDTAIKSIVIYFLRFGY